jgi:alpha-L-rhamnosidase
LNGYTELLVATATDDDIAERGIGARTALREIRVCWSVLGDKLTVDADIPLGMAGVLRLPGGMELALRPSHMSVTMPMEPSA